MDAVASSFELCQHLQTGPRRLLERNSSRGLVVQARGVAGAELLAELVRCGRIDVLVLLSDGSSGVPLQQELLACGADIVTLTEQSRRFVSC